jgi:hypothetical protein
LFIFVLSMHSDLLLKAGLMRPTGEASVRSNDDPLVITSLDGTVEHAGYQVRHGYQAQQHLDGAL